MKILIYIINLFSPIVNTAGLIGLCGCVVYDDLSVLVISAIMAVVGLALGIFAYRYDIPPRWFWSRSSNQLFDFAITKVLGYAFSLAMWPGTIYLVIVLVNAVSNVE